MLPFILVGVAAAALLSGCGNEEEKQNYREGAEGEKQKTKKSMDTFLTRFMHRVEHGGKGIGEFPWNCASTEELSNMPDYESPPGDCAQLRRSLEVRVQNKLLSKGYGAEWETYQWTPMSTSGGFFDPLRNFWRGKAKVTLYSPRLYQHREIGEEVGYEFLEKMLKGMEELQGNLNRSDVAGASSGFTCWGGWVMINSDGSSTGKCSNQLQVYNKFVQDSLDEAKYSVTCTIAETSLEDGDPALKSECNVTKKPAAK